MTQKYQRIATYIWISTHTLTWSVTTLKKIFGLRIYDFNSHAHVERDLYHWNSLHRTCRFQLTRSRGAWLETSSFYDGENKFQLTRSRGAWPFKIKKENIVYNFNSHAHVERDILTIYIILQAWISTHTLTWSVTHLHYMGNSPQGFQLTRSRGAWQVLQ